MPGRFGELPFAGLTPALVAGIAVAGIFRESSFSLLAAGELLLTLAAACALLRQRTSIAVALLLAGIAVSGWLIALGGKTGHADDSLSYLLSHNLFPLDQLVLFEACVVDETRAFGEAILTVVEFRGVRSSSRWARCRGRAELRISGTAGTIEEVMPELRIGDRIRGWATWRVPAQYRNPGAQNRAEYLTRRGIVLVGRAKSPRVLEVLPADCSSALDRTASSLRVRLRTILGQIGNGGMTREAAILASILLGDASWLDPETRDAFQNSGTYHVLVVSGLHIAWIAWVAAFTLKTIGIPETLSRLLSASIILAYAVIVGFQASISRALWTYALYVIGRSLYRRGEPANVALATAFLLLALRPNWLQDPGFQLSFASVLAIVLMSLPIHERILRPLVQPLLRAGKDMIPSPVPGKAGRAGRRLRTEVELLAESCGDRWGRRCENALLSCGRLAARGGYAVASMLLVSLSVQIWLEPILAYHFNRISWIAPLANILIVPLSSVVLAVGALAVSAAAVLPSVDWLLAAAGLLAGLLFRITSWFCGFPAAWLRCPTPSGPIVAGSILALFVWHVFDWRAKWLPCATAGGLLMVLAFAAPPAHLYRGLAALADSSYGFAAISQIARSAGRGPDDRRQGRRSARHRPAAPMGSTARMEMTFLDVGQGDSVVIRFPDSRVWVVDAGGTRLDTSGAMSASRFDVGEAVVSRYLWHRWIPWLDLLVLSHPHLDHAGGMPALIRNFRPAGIACESDMENEVIRSIVAAAGAAGVRMVPQGSLSDMQVAGVRIETFRLPQDRYAGPGNDNSLVIRLTYGRFSALLPGDIERAAETELATRWQDDFRVDLLKVAHHGSRSSTSEMFLDRVRPKWAVISAGRNNPFGEPSRDVVLRLARRGVLPLLSMDQGAITLATDGEWYTLSTFVSGVLESRVLPGD